MSSSRKKTLTSQLSEMESILKHRDRVGVPDAILLEDFANEDVFIENLFKRYNEHIIYTYIGHVLVSVNPYQDLGLYSESFLEAYRNVSFYEVSPHLFAIAENAYKSLTSENVDQCILISGESGAGKTEASKQVLRFIAASSLHRKEVDRVRDRLLQSNPVLEAFGNAKTNRNDNSSRFGKYMDIECDFKGAPLGGHILNYLLEKSRVVHQENGERNFHIFYQLLSGCPDNLLERLHLTRNPADYYYLKQGDSSMVDSIDDKKDFKMVREAFNIIEFSEQEEENVFDVLAAILHIGNLSFSSDSEDQVTVNERASLQYASELMKCDLSQLENSFTHRTIEARQDIVRTPLTEDQACYARDALSKAIYGRIFDWLVRRLNLSLQSQEKGYKGLLGILDIYGFEIFDRNGFEQFCINYCNEKLQQIFIELTLKSEQEEYLKEGIEWEQVSYFNNKIICDLIEEKHKGIISILDEECLRPGDTNDMTFLEKMNRQLGTHEHFISYETSKISKVKKTINQDEFRLRHYAGEVGYSVKGFIDKNNDLLFRDLKEAMIYSNNPILAHVFPKKELFEKKLPDTAGTQFKTSLSHLMKILMSKEPSYIRCIKPNDVKLSNKFVVDRVNHQVKYLGLMENVRVRRAGFAYRRTYEYFLGRYKSVCPTTWPKYYGNVKEGVHAIVTYLNFQEDEYRMGTTKIFIRLPRTLFRIEDAYQVRKCELATMIQAKWRGVVQRRRFEKMKAAVTLLASHWRKITAQRLRKRRAWAALVIRKFLKGFITRNDPVNEDNARFQQLVRYEFLMNLSTKLPRSILDGRWVEAPYSCKEVSKMLQDMYRLYLAGRYVKNLKSDAKKMLEEKVLAESLFKGNKANYEKTFPSWFVSTRLDEETARRLKTGFEDIIKPQSERTLYSTPCTKYDRHGYSARERILILTSGALYLLQVKEKVKQKHRFSLKEIHGLKMSTNVDNFLLIQIPLENAEKDKGDLLLNLPNVIEAVTKIIAVTDNPDVVSINNFSMVHQMKDGKTKTIMLDVGDHNEIDKHKDGRLHVVAAH